MLGSGCLESENFYKVLGRALRRTSYVCFTGKAVRDQRQGFRVFRGRAGRCCPRPGRGSALSSGPTPACGPVAGPQAAGAPAQAVGSQHEGQ